jgi:4-amino-4-deoxy-L-arabinose transferase-like glycosyltransferase
LKIGKWLGVRNVILLFLASLALRVGFAVLFQYDGLYGQDPFAYFEYTAALRAALAAGEDPPSFFWPLGYPVLTVIASFLTGLRPLAGQAISVLAGATLAPLVYLIVLEIEPDARLGGFVAGLLMGTAAQLMLSSLSYMSDAAALAWATLSTLALLRYMRDERPSWLSLAAMALGWAVITRWVYALVVIPWGLAAFLHWRQANIPWGRRVKLAGLAILVGGAILAAQLILTMNQEGAAFTGNLQVTTWDPANAFRRTVTYADGTFTYERPVGIFYALSILHPAFVFPLLTPFLLYGLWSCRKRPPAQTALILGWPLIIYLFLVGTWENSRFSLAFFPPLAVLTGLGIHTLWSNLPQLPNYQLPITNYQITKLPLQTLLTLYLSLALLGSLAWAGRDLRNFITVNNAQIAAVHWVEEQVPSEATVITFGVTLTMRHRTGLTASEIYYLNPILLDNLVETQDQLYLFLDLENINSQWEGLTPQENYRWLQENSELSEIEHYPPYTLFRVSAVP